MEYAATALGVRLIAVLGHSGCGAVKAAIDTVVKGGEAPGHLPALINEIRPAIEAVRGRGDGVPPLQAVTRAHVERGVAELRANRPILAGLTRSGQVRVVGLVYDIKTGRVTPVRD